MTRRWLPLAMWCVVAGGAAVVGLAAVAVVRDVVADDPVEVLSATDVDRLLSDPEEALKPLATLVVPTRPIADPTPDPSPTSAWPVARFGSSTELQDRARRAVRSEKATSEGSHGSKVGANVVPGDRVSASASASAPASASASESADPSTSASPTPTPTPTPSPSPDSPTPDPSPSPEPSPSGTATPSSTPSGSPTSPTSPSASGSPSTTGSPTPTPSAAASSGTPTATATASPTGTPSPRP